MQKDDLIRGKKRFKRLRIRYSRLLDVFQELSDRNEIPKRIAYSIHRSLLRLNWIQYFEYTPHHKCSYEDFIKWARSLHSDENGEVLDHIDLFTGYPKEGGGQDEQR